MNSKLLIQKLSMLAITLSLTIGQLAIFQLIKYKSNVLLKVKTIDQVATGYSKGCEGVSLYMGLSYKNKMMYTTLDQFMETIPTDENNPYFGFVGDLDKKTPGKRQTIYPKALAKWGNEYGNVKDQTGASCKQLIEELENGNPSVVYLTSHLNVPKFKTFDFGTVVTNGHVVLLTGYNPVTHQYIINDCYKGIGETYIDQDDFEYIYNFRKYAVTIY